MCALAWPGRLGAAARRALKAVEAGRAIAWIPAAVAAEIALLRERNRIDVGVPQLRTAMERTPGLQFLILDLRQVEEFTLLTAINDPFDRLILSACRATGAQLIRRDMSMIASKIVRSVWD